MRGAGAQLEQLAEMVLDPETVEQWAAEELSACYAPYQSLLQRREQREWSALYLQGLLSEILHHKTSESIVLALMGADPQAIRNMQPCIGAGT